MRLGRCQFIISTIMLSTLSFNPCASAQEVNVVRFRLGDTYRIMHKSDLTATATEPAIGNNPPRKLATEGKARIAYRERVIGLDERGKANKIVRIYDKIDDHRKVNGQEQETAIRPSVYRIVVDRNPQLNKIYCPDGPLTWTELQYYELHETAPMLEGFLPDGSIRMGQTWTADQSTVREFANLTSYQSGELSCQFDGYVDFKGQKLGRIAFQGTLVGANYQELVAGGSAKVHVNGAIYFDDQTKRLHSMRTLAEREIFDRNKTLVGSMKDDFQLAINYLSNDADLTDTVAEKLKPAPTESQLNLLYEQPGLGIRVLHPRRWQLATVVGNQLLFEFMEGGKDSSVVFHVEPEAKTPSTKSFCEEVEKSFAEKGIAYKKSSDVQEVESAAGRLGTFRLMAELDNRKRILDYWTIEINKRGMTVLSRIAPEDAKIVAADIEEMVRNVRFMKPLVAVPPLNRTEMPQSNRKTIPAAQDRKP